jgi:hypothetical protein
VMPLMTRQSDNLTVGTPVTYVGYGLVASPPDGTNSQRRSVVKPITSLDAFTVQYDDTDGEGPCNGDSGGPGLVVVDDVEQVAVVTSVGNAQCNGVGSSVRVSAIQADFVAPVLLGLTPAPTCPSSTDCSACATVAQTPGCGGGCARVTEVCADDTSCAALVTCISSCDDASCAAACPTQNLSGLQKYEAITACICSDSCATLCGSDPLCLAPKCGATPPGAPPSCSSCLDDACCIQAWTCAADPVCSACFFSGSSPPSCASNASAAAFSACSISKCGARGCALASPPGDAGSVGADAGQESVEEEWGGAGGSEHGAADATSNAHHDGCTCTTTSYRRGSLVWLGAAFALFILATERARLAGADKSPSDAWGLGTR